MGCGFESLYAQISPILSSSEERVRNWDTLGSSRTVVTIIPIFLTQVLELEAKLEDEYKRM